MDSHRFDELTRRVAQARSRRSLGNLLGATVVSTLGLAARHPRHANAGAVVAEPADSCVECTNAPCASGDCRDDPCYRCNVAGTSNCIPINFLAPITVCPCSACAGATQTLCFFRTSDGYDHTGCDAYAQQRPSTEVTDDGDSSDLRVQEAVVTRVIDGDTIRVDVGTEVTVTLLGILAPALKGDDGPECFAEEAASHLRERLEGERVLLGGSTRRDSVSHWWRYVWVGLGGGDPTLVNFSMAQSGHAYAHPTSLDHRYDAEIAQGQQQAQAASRGLWAVCPATPTP